MDWIIVYIEHITQRIPLLLNALAMLVIAKLLFDRLYPCQLRSQLLNKHNMAYACMLGAFLLATAWALAGTFPARIEDPWQALWKAIPEGLLSVLLLLVSTKMNAAWLLSRFKVTLEIGHEHNLGTAFCVAGSTLASGHIIHTAAAGVSPDFLAGLTNMCLYWWMGQALFVVAGQCYQWLKPYNVQGLIAADDNSGVGMEFGACLFASGLIICGAMSSNGQHPIQVEVYWLFTGTAMGTLLLIAGKRIVTYLIASHPDFEDAVIVNKNLTVSALFSMVTIGCGFFIAAMIAL